MFDVSFNCGVKVVYFMPEAVRREMDEHARSYWWSLFCDVTESGMAVVQDPRLVYMVGL